MTSLEIKNLLSLVLDILRSMTESGAEIYRVEESAVRIFGAYGIKQTDIYATTSNIIISLEDADDKIYTDTRRIAQISTNLEKMDKLNALVRHIAETKPSCEEIKTELSIVEKVKEYSPILTVLAYGFIASMFYLFFSGRKLSEFLVSALCGIVTGIIAVIVGKIGANKFLNKFLCSFATCLISFTFCNLRLIASVDYIIIGTIMTLIPGIGLTNALRDLFTGDSISGTLRLIEATLLALAIACGYIVTNIIFGGAL